MAYTSIIPVSRLDNSITYIRNKDKTTKKGQSAGSLEEAIDYAMNRDKTERSVFEDAIGCVCETAYQDMVATKKRYHKMDGVQGYHLVQSFAKGEVTPELAHQIGMELAERLLQGKYEAVITTHLNTEHYHNHIVFNSVSMEDGKKYHSNSRSYYEDVRKASDALCLKYGLSVIEPKNGKGKSYAQWMAEQDGKPTWRTSIRLDIRDAVAESFTWKQFLDQMKQRGYQWKLNRKYIALKAPGMERYIRLRSLGKHYSEESIRQWILQPKSRTPAGKEGDSRFPKKKLKGIQALYYSYLYQMGVLKQKPKRISPVLRADIRKLDARIEQMEFLQKHQITTREELLAYRTPLEEQVQALTKERKRLYRSEPDSVRIGQITEELKPLRKDIRICIRIEQQSQRDGRKDASGRADPETGRTGRTDGEKQTNREQKAGEQHELWRRCGGPDRPVFPGRRGPRAQAFGYAGKASGGICCRRIKRPEENEGQDQNGADVKGEQAIEVLHCAI